jgi:hypothetical protein
MRSMVMRTILACLLGCVLYVAASAAWFLWLARCVAPPRASSPTEIMSHVMLMSSPRWLVTWTAIGGLVASAGALRRRRRIKRGLCPVCAYPIRDSDVCTECGAPVVPSIAQ